MIRVAKRPQPPNFNELVGRPGRAFLKITPNPTKEEWDAHDHWKLILPQLRTSYNRICAYSCHWISADTGFRSVEHFAPKNRYPKLAYVWRNYRLVCGRLNGRKSDFEDVLDPFKIQDGWFVLDFQSMQVKPADGLTTTRRAAVKATIKRLKLNDDDTCVEARQEWITEYCRSPGIPFESLRRYAPFIAKELKRQKMVESIRDIYGGASGK